MGTEFKLFDSNPSGANSTSSHTPRHPKQGPKKPCFGLVLGRLCMAGDSFLNPSMIISTKSQPCIKSKRNLKPLKATLQLHGRIQVCSHGLLGTQTCHVMNASCRCGRCHTSSCRVSHLGCRGGKKLFQSLPQAHTCRICLKAWYIFSMHTYIYIYTCLYMYMYISVKIISGRFLK